MPSATVGASRAALPPWPERAHPFLSLFLGAGRENSAFAGHTPDRPLATPFRARRALRELAENATFTLSQAARGELESVNTRLRCVVSGLSIRSRLAKPEGANHHYSLREFWAFFATDEPSLVPRLPWHIQVPIRTTDCPPQRYASRCFGEWKARSWSWVPCARWVSSPGTRKVFRSAGHAAWAWPGWPLHGRSPTPLTAPLPRAFCTPCSAASAAIGWIFSAKNTSITF